MDILEFLKYDEFETQSNYQYKHWYDQMIQSRQYYRDLIYRTCIEKGEKDIDKIIEKEMELYRKTDKYEQRELTIQKWFTERNLDFTLDIKYREKYMRWYLANIPKENEREETDRIQKVSLSLKKNREEFEKLMKDLRPFY